MNIITFQIDKYVQKFSFLMITEPILQKGFKIFQNITTDNLFMTS